MKWTDFLRGFREWRDEQATPERVDRIVARTMAALELSLCPMCHGISRTNEYRRCGAAGYIFRARHVPCPANCDHGMIRVVEEQAA